MTLRGSELQGQVLKERPALAGLPGPIASVVTTNRHGLSEDVRGRSFGRQRPACWHEDAC